MAHPQVVLATCRAVLESGGDDAHGRADSESGDHLLAIALREQGFDPVVAAWDEPRVDWSKVAACVLRSTWDYPERLDDFVQWAETTNKQTLLLNGLELIRWNLRKSYLVELRSKGLPVVPTVVIERGNDLDAERITDELRSSALVVKPAIGAGSIGVWRGDVNDAGWEGRVRKMTMIGDVVIQPYVATIASSGEVATVMVDGRVSHAVVKKPAPGDYRVQPHLGGTSHAIALDGELRALADAVAAALPWEWVYGRIDTVSIEGHPHIMELELIEPSLFLAHAPGAASLLARSIVERIQKRS